MSTDEEQADERMASRLGAAGQRWRSANPEAAALGGADFAIAVPAAPTLSNPRRWIVAASAAAIVAALVGGTVYVATRPSHSTKQQAVGPGPGPVTADGLAGVNWTLFTADVESSKAIDGLNTSDTKASLRFDTDGAMQGSDGCNTVSGSSTHDATTIHFGQLASTAIGCPDTDVSKLASFLDSMLQGDVGWHIQYSGSGAFLTLDKAGVGSLIYVGTPAAHPTTDPSQLVGEWSLVGTEHQAGNSAGGSGSASGSGSSGFDSYLDFDGKGGFTTTEQCYTNEGDAAVVAGKVTFSNVRMKSALPCASQASSDEQQIAPLVDRTLSGVTTWSIDHDQLSITKGGDTLTYARGHQSAPTKNLGGTPSGGTTK